MGSAGKWVLGLLLLVVGAVFVAKTVSTGTTSQAEVKNLPPAAPVAAAQEGKKKKEAPAPATDVACKKACIEVNEVSNDAVTTAKLAPGSVTLSKLAFEVPNLNELENEIAARKAAEASAKAAVAEASAITAKNDAAITAAAQNGLVSEAAARAAAVDDLTKKFAAGDADLLSKLNKETSERAKADDVLQLKLNTEIADRASALSTLRGELANPNQVSAPIVKINNNEIVGDAVTTDKLADATIQTQDLANALVVNTKLAADAVTTDKIKNGTILTEDIGNGQVTFPKLDGSTQSRINGLESGLAAEIVNRTADVDAEQLARTNADAALQNALDAEALTRGTADSALQAALSREADDRSAADNALQSALNTEMATRAAADTAQVAAFTEFRGKLLDADAQGASQPNDNDGLVHWSNLEGVPADVLSRTAADLACSGCVGAADIAPGAVGTAQLADASNSGDGTTGAGVTRAKIENLAVDSSKLADGAVTMAKLGSDVEARFVALETNVSNLTTRLDRFDDPLTDPPPAGDTERVHTTRLTGQQTVSANLNPAPIGATSRLPQLLAVSGVQVGDVVTVSPPATLDDDLLFVGSDVLADGFVTVYLYNASAAPIDDVALDWTVRFIDVTPSP